MDLLAAYRDRAEAALAEALRNLAPDAPLPGIETPPDPALGDLGLPCFPLAKALRRAPAEIAVDLAAAAGTDGDGKGDVEGIRFEAAGPYVNVRFDGAAIARAVLDDVAAALTCAPTGERVLLEHTSANPNGPLHVGRARNPILGDCLARILRAAGHDVEAQYYMDNLGRQVALLAWGKWHIPADDLPPVAEGREEKPDHVLVRCYQAAHDRMKADPAVEKEIKELVARLEDAEPALVERVREVYEACFSGMRQSLERLGVSYDSIKDESDLVQDGSVHRVVDALRASPRHGVEEDGAHYLDLAAELAGQKDRFYFTRRDGTSVYATRDVAYHLWKAEHIGGGRLVDVLGEDHRLQALQVGVALEELGHTRPHVVFYAFVSLPEGKMSTRAGRVVFLDDLMDEAVARARQEVGKRRGEDMEAADMDAIAEAVGIGAIRFNIARVQPEKPIAFRWEDALDFEGDSAPYLMYAHARASSIVRVAQEAGMSLAGARAEPGEGEVRLLKLIARMPGVTTEAARQYAPHRFCSYALELATAFNEYYRDHRVVGHPDEHEARLRLQVVHAARAAMAQTLGILGLAAPDVM